MSAGRVTSESSKVFEVYPGLGGEDRYRRLIEEDGKRLSAAALAKQDRERQKTAEEYARKQASHRIGKRTSAPSKSAPSKSRTLSMTFFVSTRS